MKTPELEHSKRRFIGNEAAKQLGYKVSHACPKARSTVEVDLQADPRCPHCGVIFQVEEGEQDNS